MKEAVLQYIRRGSCTEQNCAVYLGYADEVDRVVEIVDQLIAEKLVHVCGQARLPDTDQVVRVVAKYAENTEGTWGDQVMELFGQWRGCTRCLLAGTRRNVVFCAGHLQAPIAIIGDYPLDAEDASGIAHSGDWGVLRRIWKTTGINHQSTWSAHLLGCMPKDGVTAGAREPRPAEYAACLPRVAGLLNLGQPRIVVLTGNANKYFFDARLPDRYPFMWKGVVFFKTYDPRDLVNDPVKEKFACVEWSRIRETLEKQMENSAPKVLWSLPLMIK